MGIQRAEVELERSRAEVEPMSDSGGTNGPIEPGEAECSMVHAGFEGGRSADTGARATGPDRAEHSEAGGSD